MQPNLIKRRVFLQGLFGLPMLAFLHPKPAHAEPVYTGLVFTDSEGNADLTALADKNTATGMEYAA
jgi:hypothetical protein